MYFYGLMPTFDLECYLDLGYVEIGILIRDISSVGRQIECVDDLQRTGGKS